MSATVFGFFFFGVFYVRMLPHSGYPPTAIGYPPPVIVGRIGHSEFFFLHYGTPWGGLSAGKRPQGGMGGASSLGKGTGVLCEAGHKNVHSGV